MFIPALSLFISSPGPEGPCRVRQGLPEAVLARGIDVEPSHRLLLAKPCRLPLRVAPRVPLRQGDRLADRDLAPQVTEHFPVSEGLEGVSRRIESPRQQPAQLLDQTVVEEPDDAL